MRAALGVLGLVVVLAIVGLTMRSQLHALKQAAPAPAADAQAASAPFGGTSSPSVAQFQQELDKQMRNAAARAASADAGDNP